MTRKPKSAKTPAKTIDGYLAKVSDDQRVALEKLRKTIKAVMPKAEECICYQIPSFRLGKKYVVSFAAWANHCAFYPGSHAIKVHQAALKSYDLDKGTVRFPVARPLPSVLVRKLVRARIAQING